MTKRELLDYILEVGGKLGLEGWNIIVEQEDTDEYNARIAVQDNMRFATFITSNRLLEEDREHVRYVVTHELIHIHLNAMDAIVRDLPDIVGTATATIVHKNHMRADEIATDTLARAIAPLMPLPKKVKKC